MKTDENESQEERQKEQTESTNIHNKQTGKIARRAFRESSGTQTVSKIMQTGRSDEKERQTYRKRL